MYKKPKDFKGSHYAMGRALSNVARSPDCNMSTNASVAQFTPFLVVSRQHSETTWLTRMLHSPPWIYMFHELFVSYTFQEEVADKFFNHVCWTASCCDRHVFAGFVLQEGQGWLGVRQRKKLLEYMKRRSVKVVVLERLNVLEQSLASSGAGHNGKHVTEKPTHKIVLSREYLKALKQRTSASRARYRSILDALRSQGTKVQYVTYEGLSRERTAAVIKIMQFLGQNRKWIVWNDTTLTDDTMKWRLTVSTHSKHHQRSVKERVRNLNESLEILQRHFPSGVCMLEGNCEFTPALA